MRYTKTQQAIINVLQQQREALCADEIFLQLNPGKKCYSYAAIYQNISQLCREGVLSVEKPEARRSRAVKINQL
ncbi:transcriptional repressor [Sphingobacterium sp. lm-10]|uniref:transcriptional repressor n=1 Tax=Sphingobacterium sp. lm-10 TaxID=2944904 RepID=UPI002020561D|nr:transcriptional repressor [Sphingobacterium sp. lm-10]MCL7986846.1 transcriptional repressor [Sphingobacterium sp. lm-10]